MFWCSDGGFVLQISRGVTLFVPYEDRSVVESSLHGSQRVPGGKLVASCDRQRLSVHALVVDGGAKFTFPLVHAGTPVGRANTFRDLYHEIAERDVEAFTGDAYTD